MSQKSHKKRSYRDALTGDRNEFIGSPVMSGGEADASGASTPSREKKINSNKKQKSPKGANRAVVPETPANPPAAEAVDWDAAFDKALTVGQPELVVPAEAGNEFSLTLVVTRSLPVLPEHRQEIAEFVRNWPQSDFAGRQQVAQTKPRRMVIQDLKDCFACRRDDAELLLQLSAYVHGHFYAGESAPVEHHAIAMWCGKILFENDEAYSDSEWVHGEVPDDSASEVSAPMVMARTIRTIPLLMNLPPMVMASTSCLRSLNPQSLCHVCCFRLTQIESSARSVQRSSSTCSRCRRSRLFSM